MIAIRNWKFLAVVFLIFFIPRIISLGSDISNYDASYWHPRTEKFAKHLIRGEYAYTYQQYHPGVTLLWLSGSAKWMFETAFESYFDYSPRHLSRHFIKINFVSIFPLILVISLLGAYCAWLMSKITGNTFAIIFTIFLSLEPFFLGVSKFLHLSGLGGMFSFASFLSLYYHYYLRQQNEAKAGNYYFYLSAIFIGLGILTKIDSGIGMLMNVIFAAFQEFRISGNKIRLKSILGLIKYGLIATIVFVALFPSMWVRPYWTIREIINEGIVDTAFSSEGEVTISGIKKLFYLEFIFLRNLPSTFLLMIAGLFIGLRKFMKHKVDEIDKFVLYSGIAYVVLNIAILTIPDKAKDRYISNFYPSLILISSYAFYYFYKYSQKAKIASIAILFIIYTVTLYRYYPAYSYYFTDLVGGPGGVEALGVPVKNRGEYYAQAAQYINKIDPDAPNRNAVLTHREQIKTFAPFFYGKDYTNPKLMPEGALADYIVSRRDLDYLVPKDMCNKLKAFGPSAPFAYEAVIVYKCSRVDNQYKEFKN